MSKRPIPLTPKHVQLGVAVHHGKECVCMLCTVLKIQKSQERELMKLQMERDQAIHLRNLAILKVNSRCPHCARELQLALFEQAHNGEAIQDDIQMKNIVESYVNIHYKHIILSNLCLNVRAVLNRVTEEKTDCIQTSKKNTNKG